MQLVHCATAALVVATLSISARAQHANADTPPVATPAPWTAGVDVRASTELGAYADTDHVYVVSPGVTARVGKASAGWSVGGNYVADVVSAASVDIVSTASRRWEEVRHAGGIDFAYKPGNFGFAASASISVEPDYLAIDGGGAVSYDLFHKSLTLSVGYQHGHDVAGRHTTPFSVFNRMLESDAIKAGATVILDRSTLMSFVGDVNVESGDQSKPYRYVPLFAPGTYVPVGASIDTVNRLRLSARVLDQTPLSRDRYTFAVHLAHRFSASTIRMSERMYIDTWGLKSTTTDGRFLLDLGRRVELGPHVRFHAQTPVDFWQRAYTMRAGLDFPAIRTGDRELGPLVNATFGGTLRVHIGPEVEPTSWTIGLDVGGTQTQYLDDLYITSRTSVVGALTLEVAR